MNLADYLTRIFSGDERQLKLAVVSPPEGIDKKAVRQAFDEMAGFFVDSKDKALARFAQRCYRIKMGIDFAEKLLQSNNDDLAGVELKNNMDQYAVLLPDASQQGRFRASLFDKRGFFSHITRDNYAEVLEELLQQGYRKMATGSLTALSQGEKWKAV
jgi:hypothetical protein